jgi:hypothetical protein
LPNSCWALTTVEVDFASKRVNLNRSLMQYFDLDQTKLSVGDYLGLYCERGAQAKKLGPTCRAVVVDALCLLLIGWRGK